MTYYAVQEAVRQADKELDSLRAALAMQPATTPVSAGTEEEKFHLWFEIQRANGLKNFKPTWNLQGLANKFGGKLVTRWCPMTKIPYEAIDWSESTSTEEERREYLYGQLNKMVDACNDATPLDLKELDK